MKKWLMLCLALLISLALVACGSNDSDSNADNDEDATENSEEETDNDSSADENADEEEADAEEEAATEEDSADAEASTDSAAFDFDPNGENIVTLEMDQAGIVISLTYKAEGDIVYEQTTNSEISYEAIGVTTPEEAEELMGEAAAEFQGLDGITHNFEYQEDKLVETLAVNYDEASIEEVSQLPGSEFNGDASSFDVISLQQSVDMLLSQGYEIVE